MAIPPAAQAVIYVRISEDRVGGGLGVSRQEADCRELAERLGVQIRQVYIDNDMSAYSGKPRPGYQRMLADLDAEPAVVLAWHTDRLHRSPRELEDYITLADRRGIVTHCVKAGELDLSTPSGRAVARTLGAWARYESEHRAERVAAAYRNRALDGGYGGGIRPFGFEPDGITPRPAEAAEIVTAVDELLAGASLRSVTREMNARGARTSRGKPWTPSVLRDMLMRPRNAGIAVYRGEEVKHGAWPAIIPEDKFRAVVALMSDPARRTSPGNAVRWFGSGLFVCGECGTTLICTRSGGSSQPSYRCRGCGKTVRSAAKVDELVNGVIVARLSRPDAADLLDVPDVDTTALTTEATALRARLEELGTLFADGAIDARQLRAGTERLRGRLDGIESQLATAAASSPLAEVIGADDVAARWDALGLDRRRAVLATLMDVVLTKSRPGRMPDGTYFDRDAVLILWHGPDGKVVRPS